MRTALVLLLTLALVGLIEAAYHVFRWLSARRLGELRRRLNVTAGQARIDSELLRQGRFASWPALDAWLSTQPWARQLEHLLEQADAQVTVAQLVGLSLLAGSLGLLSGAWTGLVPGLVLGAAGLLGPRGLLLLARERRSRKISAQLPEALDMISRSLRAGHALSAAFELVASEMPEPISVEFSRAHEEQRLGMPLDRVVLEMSARAPGNGDLKIFAVSAVIQRETGGNLAEMLTGIGATIRERDRFFGKLRALTAEARASAWAVSLMPLAVFLLLAVIQTGYLAPLFTTPLGRSLLAGGVVFWVAGVAWFARLTRFRY